MERPDIEKNMELLDEVKDIAKDPNFIENSIKEAFKKMMAGNNNGKKE